MKERQSIAPSRFPQQGHRGGGALKKHWYFYASFTQIEFRATAKIRVVELLTF